MERWFRLGPGRGDDVVYELKSGWFFLIPASVGWGYRRYANAASNRNRLAVKLNALSEEMEEVIVKFAKAEAELKADKDQLDAEAQNHLGEGTPFEADPSTFKNMLPYVAEPKPLWKAFVASPVWKRVLRENGAVETASSRAPIPQPRMKGRIVISPSDAITKHPEAFANDNAEQLVQYKSPGKQGNKQQKGQGGNGSKATIKSLRSEFPREEDEGQSDWDKRLKEIASERNENR